MSPADGTLRLNVWSGPRNLSTALMYSWRQRADTTVVDEPLYAHYLRVSGREHPGREAVLASQNTNGDAVVRDLMMGPWPTRIVFFKQMAKHLVELDRSFMNRCRNVLLTREPVDMLISFERNVPDITLDDTGLVELVEILEWIEADGGEPIVVDSKQLLLDPERVLGELCRRLGIEFDPAMLSWPSGPKPEDGVWAEYWYDGVWASTGWGRWEPRDHELSERAERVLEQAMPLYQRLLPYSISAT